MIEHIIAFTLGAGVSWFLYNMGFKDGIEQGRVIGRMRANHRNYGRERRE